VDGVVGDYLCQKYGDIKETPLRIEIEENRIRDLQCENKELLEEFRLQLVMGRTQVEKRDRSCKSRISEHALNVAAPRAGHHTTSA